MAKSAEWHEMRVRAMAYVCPDCHAAAGDPCINEWNGSPVVNQPAHPRRLALSEHPYPSDP
jgi:hypothetical protein